MVEKIPFSFKFSNGVMRSPSYYWRKNYSLIDERTIGIISNGIAQEMSIPGRVREVILTLVFVHP